MEIKGILALIGGGEWREGCSFDAELVEASGCDEILVLPTAAAYEYPEKSVEWARGYFKALGVRVLGLDLLRRPDAFRGANVEAIEKARFIYVGGGSPLHLRSVLKGTPALRALTNAYLDGAILAASSAGAMALTDPMADPRGGALTVGLGLICNLALVPHFDTYPVERERRTISLAENGIVVAGVDERTALIRRPGGAWEAAGAGGVALFEKGDRLGLHELESRISLPQIRLTDSNVPRGV